MDLETYELIKTSSSSCEEQMEKSALAPLIIAGIAAGIAALVGGGTAVYQGRKQQGAQTRANTAKEKELNEQRLPGQGPVDPLPSQYPGQVPTGNPWWDALGQEHQEYLADREGYAYGPDNYGPKYYTNRNWVNPTWGPARDPSLPIDSGVPYNEAHLGHVIPENKGIWAWDPTTPGGLRSTIEMNYAMSQYGPESGQKNFNVGWQEAIEKEEENVAAGKDRFSHIDEAEKAYQEATTPFKQ